MANLSNINNKFLVTTGGNVGINSTSPGEKLEVNGNIQSLDTIYIKNASNGVKWQFYRDGNETLNFRYNNGTDWNSNAISIKNNNNVGIGTTGPLTKLDVRGSTFVSGYLAGFDTTPQGNYAYRLTNDGANSFINVLGGNLGIGTSSPGAKLEIFGGGNTLRMDSAGNTAKTFLMRNVNTAIAEIKTDGNLDINIEDAGRTMRFLNGNIERIKINDAGNVFISTPITNAFYGISLTYNSSNTADFTVNQATGQIKIGGVATGYFPTFYSAGSERMRILSNGNIAFNATSNLNSSNFQISTNSGLGANVDVFIANTSGTPYVNSATTTQLSMGFLSGTADYVATGQRLGALQFFGQASDAGYGAGSIKSVVTTGGNVGRSSHAADLTFETKAAGSLGNTEKMRILGNGNVGIGTTTNINAPLTIQSDGSAGAINLIGRSNGVYDESIISFYDFDQTTRKGYILNSGGNMFFSTGNGSENMTILSGGSVGIGVTSPAAKLHVKGGDISVEETGGNGNKIFFTTDHNSHLITSNGYWIDIIGNANEVFRVFGGASTTTEFFRITGGGRVLINNTNTSSDAMCHIGGNASNYALYLYADVIYASSYRYQRFRSGGNIAGGIEGSNQTSVVYNTSSDYRMKKNIKPLENGLERLSKLKPVKFDWKLNDESTEGFIAHEVQEIFPDAISGEKDGEDMQGMDYGRITPLLVAAIQELKAEIELLKSK